MSSHELEPIFRAVRLASRLCIEVQKRHITGGEKTGHEPVTVADYGSQAIICRALREYFPQDGVMAEESGAQFMDVLDDEQRAYIVGLIGEIIGQTTTVEEVRRWLDHNAGLETPRIWVVDPIDGTKGFLALRHYVVAVGLMQDRRPVGGVLGAPVYPGYPNGAMIHSLGDAAYIESLDNPSDRRRVFVTDQADIGRFRAVESVEKGHAGLTRLARLREIIGVPHDLVDQADSMEKYSRVAVGDAELYIRLPRLGSTRPHNIWDHAPGVAILHAAGGVATDVDGSPLDFSEGVTLKNYGVVASNGSRHDDLLAGVARLLDEERTEGHHAD